jgi:2-methylcitrate dehydratase PrpD
LAVQMVTGQGQQPLAQRLAASVCSVAIDDFDHAVIDKAATCLFDLIGCALESIDKPWSQHAMALAAPVEAGRPGAATVIGSRRASSLGDAAFVNGVMGHGLVREDMHSASISHLGVAILPAVLALSQSRRVSGSDMLAAIVAGYEVGARIGRALMDPQMARIFRPTGITGPLGAAAAGARLLRLDAAQTCSALALAANTTGGFNQWGHTGGSEMYVHPGFAARSGVSAALLAQAGAFASPTALDGEAGLFASHGKRAAADGLRLFDGAPEIMAVYHKPVPACNFAQTASLAAIRLAQGGQCPIDRIEGITVRVPRAGATYPGCDFSGPYAHVLQAKMSIQFNVVAALIMGGITEANFDLLEDARVHRLLAITQLEVDDEMTRVYPAQQGGAVEVRLAGGANQAMRLPDVVNATGQEVRDRFRAAAVAHLGQDATARIIARIDDLAHDDDAGRLATALARPTS